MVATPTPNRPDRTEYYLGLAVAVAARAECSGQFVGAVIVKDNRVISTGYNGTPEGWNNCSETGACPRCDRREEFGSGNGYDKCICVHAEMNAIAAAARYGMSIDGGIAYVTHEPCFTCSKELVQAGIKAVFYSIRMPDFDGAHREALEATRSRFHGQLAARRVDPTLVTRWLNTAADTFLKRATSTSTTTAAAESETIDALDPATPL